MSDRTCGALREQVPDLAAGRLAAEEASSLSRHVALCEACREELALARLLLDGRAEAPAGLERRVLEAVRRDRPGVGRPWWALSAAAVAALALGIGIVSEPAGEVEVPGYAYEVEEGTFWSSEDGLIAGAPTFEGLSDEALAQLLAELTAGGPGGAV